jgi:arginine-tRNA-protein transferase
LRVPVGRFAPSRSQRRCWTRNADLSVEVGLPALTDEKWQLYVGYQKVKHGRTDEKDVGTLRDFLYNPVVTSLEYCYRSPEGRLLAVAICDVLDDALSSVYCFYDATERRRGLGTYTALYELDYAKQQRLRYYYLGYYVKGCQAMRYKASFRPCEVLEEDGSWREGPGN